MAAIYHITADVIFFPNAATSFNLGLVKELRSSFWLEKGESSVFSATYLPHPVSINEKYEVELLIPHYGSVEDKLAIGTRFYLGLYPTAIGQGVITAILE